MTNTWGEFWKKKKMKRTKDYPYTWTLSENLICNTLHFSTYPLPYMPIYVAQSYMLSTYGDNFYSMQFWVLTKELHFYPSSVCAWALDTQDRVGAPSSSADGPLGWASPLREHGGSQRLHRKGKNPLPCKI